MSYPVLKIEGIGPKYAKKLNAIGVATTAKLLDRAKDPKGRKQLAAESDIDDGLILKWANMSDLMRIKGVAGQWAELLLASGVDTVKELRNRNAANLAKKMEEVNAEKNLTNGEISEKRVTAWVEEAKGMDPILSY